MNSVEGGVSRRMHKSLYEEGRGFTTCKVQCDEERETCIQRNAGSLSDGEGEG